MSVIWPGTGQELTGLEFPEHDYVVSMMVAE